MEGGENGSWTHGTRESPVSYLYLPPMTAVELDQTDHKILELLSQNARRTMADIGDKVSLSASAVTRRIERLERSGVIAGYTVVVDHRKAGRPIQAFTEVRYAGTADLKEIKETATQLPEVQAVFTTAGDPDALVWLQVPDVERLGQVIEQLRRRGRVTGTKTLIVLDTWSRHRAFEPERSTVRKP
jgi:Lrp/AsnC family transcriptional regulator, leucine-responsive regulatory protein